MRVHDDMTTIERRVLRARAAFTALAIVAAWLLPLQPNRPPVTSVVAVGPERVWEFDHLLMDVPGRDRLRRLAATIGRAPADTGIGSHGYVHLKAWQSYLFWDGTRWRTDLHDIERWQTVDGSCRGIEHVPGTRRYFSSKPCEPGDGPIPDGPAFITWLHHGNPSKGYLPTRIDALVRAAADWPLTRGQRAAALADLADTMPDLRWRGTVTDRSGRRGVAISTRIGPRYTIFIISPNTGELFAVATQRPPQGSITYTMPTESYILFLDRRFTFNVPTATHQ